MKKKLFVTTILALASTLLLPGKVVAQGTSAIDLGVSPPTRYFHIEPGTKKTIGVSLEQKGTLPLEITPSLVDFSSDGKTGQPVLSDSSDFRYLTVTLPKDEFSSETNSFILRPGERRNVSLTLDVPSDAIEAEYPLTVLFRAKPDFSNSVTGPGSEVSAVVASNLIVLINNSDRDRSNLLLEEIQTYKVVDSFMPISFNLLAKNSGHNATTASGSAQIKNWQGNQVAEFPIYPDMVLAQSTRLLRTTPNIDNALEDATLIKDVFNFKPMFALGPYTLTATLEKNANGVTETSTISQTVFALPFSIVIILLTMIGSWAIFNYLSTKEKSSSVLEEN